MVTRRRRVQRYVAMTECKMLKINYCQEIESDNDDVTREEREEEGTDNEGRRGITTNPIVRYTYMFNGTEERLRTFLIDLKWVTLNTVERGEEREGRS